MNFQLATIGHSFKGSMAYYLHDKRQDEAGPHPDTSDRVAWAELRNLSAAAGPETATRVMIATAQSADELKAAAGVKATGRKSTRGPVFAFSLAWHPSEADGLDRAEMIGAADHALKVLALDHLQAVIIAHRDTAHPHVHVVVNRIDPANGKAASIDGMKVKKLDAWADRYERERGQIVSPNRAKKYDQIEAAKAANPDAEKRRRYIEDKKRRPAHVAKPETAGVDRPRSSSVAPARNSNGEQRPPSRGQMLKELADAQKARHRQDWKDWGAKAKADRAAIYADADARRKLALATFKETTRGDWAQHFRAERDRARAFEAREASLSGVMRNALTAARQQFRQQPEGGRGMLALTFSNVIDSQARRQAFDLAQDMTKAQFTAAMKERRDAHLAALELEKRGALIDHSAAVDKAKADMIERQNIERGKIREAWRQHYASRDAAAPGQTYRTRKPMPLPVKEPRAMKEEFRVQVGGRTYTVRQTPTDQQRLSTPAPAPRPAGVIEPPHSEVKPVPVVDRAPPVAKPTPAPRRDWTASARPTVGNDQPSAPPALPATRETPAATSPAPQPDPRGGMDWSARAKQLRTEHSKAARPEDDQPKQGPRGPRMR